MITKNFIKQCEQADEIQKHKVVDGDYYYWSVDKKTHIAFTETFPDYKVHHPEQWDYLNGRKIIYLPTQEQLLNMLLKWCQTDKILTNILVGESINRYILKELYYYTHTFEGMLFVHDMKELILSYIYKRMYHKIWTGKKWVKKGE